VDEATDRRRASWRYRAATPRREADDLIDRLVERAGESGSAQSVERGRSAADRRDDCGGRGPLLLIKSRTKVIAFDIAEALNFEGESGPYLQYAVVRANNIFSKLRDRDGTTDAAVIAALPDAPSDELEGAGGTDDLWALALEAARLDEIVEQVVRTLEFSVLAKFAFGLAQAFNAFYHRYPILNEERAECDSGGQAPSRRARATHAALDLMGIAVPPRM
jgi:arginyl-tRNA synthetase